jgi:hypothetical protein
VVNRAFLGFQVTDLAGNIRRGQEVWLYEADGTTPLAATMYAANTGVATLTNPLTTNAQGAVAVYVTTGQRAVAVTGGIPTPVTFETDPANYLTNPISPTLFTGHAVNRVLGTTDDTTLTMLQVTTAMLASGSVSNVGFASGATFDPTTTSGTFAPLSEMDITLSTRGGTVFLLVIGTFKHTTAGKYLALGFDTDLAGGAQFYQQPVAPANDYPFLVGAVGYATGLSGSASSPVSHRFRAMWSTDGATATAVSVSRFMLAVELRK